MYSAIGGYIAALLQLASLDFLARAENLVFIGPTGIGKTGLAGALQLRALTLTVL